MDRWSGKVAVVTGTSAGIGVSIATELVKHGMKVVGLARRVERVQALADSLKGEKGELHALKADLSKEEDILSAFQWIKDNLGVVHVLVNNAGYGPYCFLTKLKNEDYSRIRSTFDTNVVGLIICSSEALKLMNDEDGHIFNINSTAGHFITKHLGFYHYNASKHAVTVITEGFRRELVNNGSKIRITSISPGAVKSEWAQASGIPIPENIWDILPHLEPKNVTDSLIHALASPPNVQIHDILIRPVGEKS